MLTALAALILSPASAFAEPAAASGGAAEEREPVTLIAFGDSLTAGYGLPAADGFAPQLQRWLEAQGAGPITVVNSGVSGETTAGGRARLDWAIGADADAVILELGANDALRGLPWEAARDNLDAMLSRLAGERGLPVLLAGMRSPGNWGQEYKSGFDGMYAQLAEKHGVPLYPFFMAGLTDDLNGAEFDPALFLPNDFHPSAKGVALIVEGIGPDVLKLVEAARSAAPPQS
ncbi:MAG: arylesterase [Pseudomonadota bacterium]